MKQIYLDLSAVAEVLSLSETTVQKLVREDEQFPKPRMLSDRRVGWLAREIESWAESRPVSTLLPPANTGRRKKRANPQQVPQAERTAA
jgi:prophage regulatory protein